MTRCAELLGASDKGEGRSSKAKKITLPPASYIRSVRLTVFFIPGPSEHTHPVCIATATDGELVVMARYQTELGEIDAAWYKYEAKRCG